MKKAAAIDVGLKRIGIALLIEEITIPQEPIFRKNREQAARDVSKFLNGYGVEILVVGLPKGGESEDEMERRIRHFCSLLDFPGETVYQNEYGSSKEAEELMKGVLRQRRDGREDSLAAKVILERWLLEMGSGNNKTSPL